jgi:enterochelin esterase-like enzyme
MQRQHKTHQRGTLCACFTLILMGVCCLLSYRSSAQTPRKNVIEQCTEDISEARGREFAKSKGGPEHNKLTNTSNPVRAGKTAFAHYVDRQGERSELTMRRTKIGETYWYGWSVFLPEDFDYRGSFTILMQLATWPTPRNGKFPGGGNGHLISIGGEGKVVYKLQHAGETADSVSDNFPLGDATLWKGKWTDFVMEAKWTGDKDGFLRLWCKVGDGRYERKIAYEGRTWWNDEGDGPYFKMGVYTGEPNWKGPSSRTLYTDEYRLGSGDARFEDVAPGGEISFEPTPTSITEKKEEKGVTGEEMQARTAGKIEDRTYTSKLNRRNVVIKVYTPPGYEQGTKRYPVVYNLHGAGGGSPQRQWERTEKTLRDAIENKQVSPMIYVFVNGLGDTFFVDYPDNSFQVESMIVQELIPWVDANYRTIATKSGRAVDGFSMGGWGCLMLAFKHPDLFCSVVSYGAALIHPERTEQKPPSIPANAANPDRPNTATGTAIGRWGDKEHIARFSPWFLAVKNQDAIRRGVRIRMVCGTDDKLYPNNVEFKTLLEQRKIPVDWVAVPGVAHDTKGLYERVGVESLKFMQDAMTVTAASLSPSGTPDITKP